MLPKWKPNQIRMAKWQTKEIRVSLWDFATTNLIVATTINVTDTINFVYNNIAATPITPIRYVISINNNGWW